MGSVIRLDRAAHGGLRFPDGSKVLLDVVSSSPIDLESVICGVRSFADGSVEFIWGVRSFADGSVEFICGVCDFADGSVEFISGISGFANRSRGVICGVRSSVDGCDDVSGSTWNSADSTQILLI